MTADLRDPQQFRAAVLGDKAAVRQSFLGSFAPAFERCVQAIHAAYTAFRDLETRLEQNHRNAITEFYLFQAINALVTSLSLMITGRLVPSGNLMRHYGEASAMALLLCHKQIPEFDRYMRDPKRYPVHRAMNTVSRPRYAQLLGIHADNWRDFVELTGFYDQYSHPSAFDARRRNCLFPARPRFARG